MGLKPKTWASVASKLQEKKSPFKGAADNSTVVKLPAKTPLRYTPFGFFLNSLDPDLIVVLVIYLIFLIITFKVSNVHLTSS